MQTAHMSRPHASLSSAARSFGAIFTGLVVVGALSHGTDALLRQAGIFPTYGEPMRDALYLLAFAYRTAFGMLGAYLSARIAAERGMRAALILGGMGTVLSAIGVVVSWGQPEMGPSWYSIALTLGAWPSAWLGGRVATRASR